MRTTFLPTAKGVVALAALVAATACSQKNDIDTTTPPTDTVETDSVLVNVEFQPEQDVQNTDDYPRSSFGIKINVAYFKDCPWADKMNESILHAVVRTEETLEHPDDKTAQRRNRERWTTIFNENGHDLQATLQLHAQEERQAYEEDLAQMKQEDNDEYIGYTNEEETYATIHTVDDRFVNWTGYVYFYLGGAHGMHMPIAITFDRNTGDVVKLDDLLKPGYEPTLRKLLKKKVREEAGVKTDFGLQEAGYWSADEVNDYLKAVANFYPERDGLTFNFAPYSIACYAVGSVSVKVTWDELKEWKKKP